MPDPRKATDHTGAALAATGGGIALGVPAVSHTERAIIRSRLKTHDKKIARAEASIPHRPPRGGRQQAARQGHTTERFNAGQKEALRLQRKAGYRKVDELKAARKVIAKPKVFPHQARLWTAAVGVGAPLSYLGARHQVAQREKREMSKKMDRHDVNAAYAGGVGAGVGYQGGVMLTKPIDWHNEKKIRNTPKHAKVSAAHSEKYRPKGMTTGDTRYREFFRNYPTNLPGGKMKRALSWTHTGKTGGAATLGVIGAGAAGSVAYNRKRRAKQDMSKRLMSDAEIKRRKKLQGHISQTTSTLGLTGLGVTGAAALASKNKGVLRAVRKAPGLSRATPHGMKNAAINTGLVSGGIGGVGGFNFASYTGAESRKKQQAPKILVATKKQQRELQTKVQKMSGPIEMGYYGDEGNAIRPEIIEAEVEKAWTPVASNYDPEEKRGKRIKNYQAGALLAGGAGATYGGIHGVKAAKEGKKAFKATESRPVERNAAGKPQVVRGSKVFRALDTAEVKTAGKHGGKAALGAGVLAAGIGAHEALRRKQKPGSSWQPYSR